MAVEAILSTALEQIINLTAPPVIRYLRPIWGGVDGDLEKLRWNLLQIQPLIEDAEERQLMDQPVKAWLMLLRDVVYDADDILDQANSHVLLIQRKAEFYGSLRSKVRDFFSLHHNPLLFQLQLGHKLRSINQRIDGIIEEMHKFSFKVADNNNKNDRPWRNRPQTHSYVPESEVIGRDKEKEEIVQMLIHDHFEEKVTVVSIVGMGGLGKTTLAQLIYGDENVKNHFQLCIWVCVSDDFDVAKLARNIMLAASKKPYADTNMEVLQQDLRQLLGLKRYLLVLDDVWNVDHLKWDALRRLLLDGTEGSRILVTTRTENCSRIMGAKESYRLQGLSEERSWALFERTLSRQPDFPEIGKKIVNKCKGLPLAIKVMGSIMLSSKSEESHWQAVFDNKIWDIQSADDNNNIRPELWLSYVVLTPTVKKCFAFCAIFPKDSFIEEGMLVQFWMAHGFIPSQTGKDPVVEGQQILDELVGRSLLQFVTDRGARAAHYFTSQWFLINDELFSVPGYRVCKMHDLIHDLAQFVTGDECSTLPERNEFMKISKRTRHFILNDDVEYDMSDHPSVRTALAVGKDFIGLSKLKLLRVLQFYHFRANVDKLLSTSIEYLHHLRYLNLCDTGIRELPESICMLVNLQTLNLNGCGQLTKLPMSMVNMNSLRHLHLRDCSELKILPPGLSQLRCWKTLTEYTVAENPENKIGELKHWNLDGELSLYDVHKVKNADEAKEANMSSRQNIKSLSLSWGLGASVENAEQVLEALKPHAALKELSLLYYPGTQFSMWVRDRQQLQNLVKINLEDCRACEQLPPLEQLPYLEELTIGGMDGIKYIINNTTGDALSLFPALRYLCLYGMDNLEGWCVEEDREIASPLFPCLEEMHIWNCPKLTTMPQQLPILKILDISESYKKAQIAIMFKEKGFFKHLNSLESLSLARCEELVLLLEDEEETRSFTSSLRSLSINACGQFSLSAVLRNLTSLRDLGMSYLEELVSWPDEMFRGLESIRSLNILSCKNLTGASSQGDCGLPFLKDLDVFNCDALIELPKCPASLKSLSISNCPKLESLPEGMQGLTSFQGLYIHHCPALKSFPKGLQQRLPTLKWLEISGCPKLEIRCSPGGDYFHLVYSISIKSIKSSPRRTLLLAPCL
ncbi:P-loop containing nucleoside triphosphate hydrolase protein [Dioscorea alata]|uniref:P-loop containing nucleoside triphosphate hydrolase protein n=2 Tax=Dioscorea alata TaxID=55571 RepID=A0ACB7VSB0_DIOAL|nr:P-loop containing nucleoside triphosphate hydrolase protein [Dioscorea alata]KAH7677271.1 P-loop containing nucleoside triphosphate hydrolase protein [Dioscorea alata]